VENAGADLERNSRNAYRETVTSNRCFIVNRSQLGSRRQNAAHPTVIGHGRRWLISNPFIEWLITVPTVVAIVYAML
jgi:hypothetical protein